VPVDDLVQKDPIDEAAQAQAEHDSGRDRKLVGRGRGPLGILTPDCHRLSLQRKKAGAVSPGPNLKPHGLRGGGPALAPAIPASPVRCRRPYAMGCKPGMPVVRPHSGIAAPRQIKQSHHVNYSRQTYENPRE
jgi:hypothetical protein